MGKKSKIGKQRRDKYYHLAKETGYRSRAAFKLIQLNRKFEFLQKSQVCVDLCAAPGGWMQVAKQNMPVSSIVIGVDLYPIKTIPGCISLIGDITTDKCRVAITRELQTWKADVVLHDGAPNVGKNWLHDEYQQACLTLSAVKLATQILRPGGWFITKVFRSRDYQPLVWVFKQLFKKVHATKPQASRIESAEIFVVCQSYIAADKIDPKFTDPKYVFEELEVEPSNKLNVLRPVKKSKAKAEGYPEDGRLLHRPLPAGEFIANVSGLEALRTASEILIDEERLLNHERTTPEIKECCKDIRVLGRKELRSILAWWKALRDEFVKPEEPETEEMEITTEKDDDADSEKDEEDEINKQITEVREDEVRELKRKRKRAIKERKKLNERLNLKMVLKDAEGPTMESENEIFSLRQVRSAGQLKDITDQAPDVVAEEASSDDEDGVRPVRRVRFADDADPIDSASDDDGRKDSINSDSNSGSDDEDAPETSEQHPLITDLDPNDTEHKRAHKAELWFERDVFSNLISEADEDRDLDVLEARTNATKTDNNNKVTVTADVNEERSSDDDSGSEDEKQTPSKGPSIKLNVEDLALGAAMVKSKKAKRDLVDAAWNRYTFNDDNLPDWFVTDEAKHFKRPEPVPAELAEEYRKQLEEMNVRSIKKVVEAKARKKKRAIRRLEKAKQKAEAVLENADLGDREKARQLRRLYKKARSDPKKETTYVVARKRSLAPGGRVKPPPGVKGPYRVVDPRMKKDMRAAKRVQQAKSGKQKRTSKHHHRRR